MTDQEIRSSILTALTTIAPDANPAELRPDLSLRDQLDLDSFDFLQLVLRVHERLGIDIPESDYRRLTTLDDAVAYLRARLSP